MLLKIRSLLTLTLIFIHVGCCVAGCAEVDSMTEAVAGEDFLLGCISCKSREEVSASTTVEWNFNPLGTNEFYPIFRYEFPDSSILHDDFHGRLDWAGTKKTEDIQIGAIYIRNVTFNDTGTYSCVLYRTLFLPVKDEHVTIRKTVKLTVVAVANRELTAVVSEIMMYVLIAALQLWMIGVLIYCYKKIYAENEAREARKAQRAKNKLKLKDSCDGVNLE